MAVFGRTRPFLANLLMVISVVTILFAVIYGYTARTFFNANSFANKVADGLTQPEISLIVAGQVTDQVIEANRDLLAFRPLILGSLQWVVESKPFRAVVRKAVQESHEAVISESGTNISLTLEDSGVIVRSALSKFPEVKEKLPAGALEALGRPHSWSNGERLAKVISTAKRMSLRTFFFLGLGLGAGAAGFALSHHRVKFLLRGSVATTSLAFVVGVTVLAGGPLFARLAGDEFLQLLVRGLWPAFVGPLALRMWVLCGMGLVVMAGVTSTFDRVDIDAISRFLRRILEQKNRPGGLAFLHAGLLIALGGLTFFNPMPVLQIVVAATAALMFFLGVQELFSLLGGLLPNAPITTDTPKGSRIGLAPRVALIVVFGGAALGAGVLWFRSQDLAPQPAPVVDACNGHPELCDLPLNDVAFPTTHNSMGGGDMFKWMFPNQEKGIPTQLADGVRGFLIDVHYGIPVGNQVKTEIDENENARATYVDAVGEEGFDAAMRIRDRIVGEPTGPRDVYLAHGFCELGNILFTDMLEQMHNFLVMNPGEVIVLVIQDEGVTPQDVAVSFEKSGLLRLVYRGPVTQPWPTLRELIDSDQRVLVFAENNSEGVPWYHPAFEVFQETPYRFLDPSEFSNIPNRGGNNGPLLLMNHWIESSPAPQPSNAEIVNSYDFLLERAQDCREERGMVPNLIAVDFYRSGDLFRVVDSLNGVEKRH